MSNQQKVNESDDSKKLIIDDSNVSISENFLKGNQVFLDKGIDSAFKQLTTNLFNTINLTFTNYNNEYEKKSDKSKEAHDYAIENLKCELKQLEFEKKDVLKTDQKTEKNIKALSKSMYKIRTSSKIFQVFKSYLEIKKQKKRYEHILRNSYFFKRKKFLIFNSWRNVINSNYKLKIQAKYSEYYNKHYNEIKTSSNSEISRLKDILDKLQSCIESEINQRHSLTKLYDLSMNKGVDVFIKETNNMIEFDCSSKFCLFVCLFNFFFF
jgi:hypothetical protein